MMRSFFAFFSLLFLSTTLLYAQEETRLKVLHLTFHRGCLKEFEAVAKRLEAIDVDTWFIPDLPAKAFDGQSKGNALYNIGYERAERIWQLHQATFESYDVILVSDTAPLSRIFLQNHWNKPLIIWICNRFDYSDQGSLDCNFPDRSYYDLFRQACQAENVIIAAYTPYEQTYAAFKGIDIGTLVIKPCAPLLNKEEALTADSSFAGSDQANTFFLPPYHNETKFMPLASFLQSLNIASFCGRYKQATDLQTFKGIIHLPYSWSTLALFENIQLGIPYFIPSSAFFEKLALTGNYFHPDLAVLLQHKLYAQSEWYCAEHQTFITYFDSWEDLASKIQQADYPALRKKTESFALEHQKTMLSRWQKVFDKFRLKK